MLSKKYFYFKAFSNQRWLFVVNLKLVNGYPFSFVSTERWPT